MRGRLIAVFLLAGIVVPASSAFAAPPKQATAGSDSIGISLIGVPGASSTNPLARNYVVDQLAPGTSLRRTVEISNTTSKTADVAVYPAAANITRGNFAFAPGRVQDALSSWTSLSSSELHLAPGADALDTLTIDVPNNASAGARYAVIWAEISAPSPVAGGVLLVNRVGVRMYLSIGPGGAAPSNFTVGSLTAHRSAGGQRLVVASVDNTGQSTLDITGDLMLSQGPGGLRGGPFTAALGAVLAPHVAEPVTARIDATLPRGPWLADLSLTSGGIHRSAVATITFPRSSAVAKATSHTRALVIALLVLLAVGALALLVFFHGFRRRGAHAAMHARHPRPSPGQHPPSGGPSSAGSSQRAGHRVSRARMVLNGTAAPRSGR